MEKKKNILYLMHIPWGWIKQRPHFIAEGLNDNHDITIVTRKEFKKAPQTNTCKLKHIRLYRIPFERYSLIAKLNSLLYKFQLKKYIKRADIIWVTSPYQLSYFNINTIKTIIYDCMDDLLEFPMSQKQVKILEKKECSLYTKANIVICTSHYLSEKLKKRYGKKEIAIVNNALKEIPQTSNNNLVWSPNCSLILTSKKIKLVYIGTISSWLDFKLIRYLTENNSNIEFYLYGPKEVEIPTIERCYHCGVIEHKYIYHLMNASDILIMPFIVNELIKSVNPVKLYEYIYSTKPCIAPFYGESKKFEEFVYLYKNKEECYNIIENIIKNNLENKKTPEECFLFTSNNTWESRLKIINKLLE